MATHDYNLANQDGASFRSDLNNALAAIVSNNSSSTAPATTFAHQIWVDTTANVIKQRNAANDSWVELWRIDGGFNAKTFSSNVTLNAQSDLRFADSDSSNWVAFQAPATVASNVTWTLPSADGTADQALVTNGSGTLSWADSGGGDNITEGNTSAEVVDTGSDGHFKVVTEGTEALRIDSSQRVGIGTTSPGNYNASADNLVISDTTAGISIVSGTSNNGNIFFADGTAGNDAFRGYVQYNHTNNALIFGSNAQERARIDSSGRLLVGTSSARSDFFNTTSVSPPVQIEGTNNNTAGLSIVRNDNGSDSPKLYLAKSRGAAVGGTTIVQSGDDIGLITFQGSDGSELVEAASISVAVDGTPGANDMPGRLVFSTTKNGASSPTERMRIHESGQTGIFSTSDNCIRAVNSAGAGTTYANYFGHHSGSSISSTGTLSFVVYTNGNVQNTNDSYGQISDIKLKENIVDATSQWDDFKAVRFRKFNFKEETGHETFTQLGVIAQELELVSPGLVYETPDLDEEGNDLGTTTKAVKSSILVKKAMVALQEAMDRIETLEAKVAALEAA